MYHRTASSLFLSGMAAYALTATTVGVVYVVSIVRSPDVRVGAVGVVAAATPEPTASRSSAVGSVSLSADVAQDSRAEAVASTFDTYFTGINEKRYEEAAAMYHPTFLDSRKPRQVRKFARDVPTSFDDKIALRMLRDDSTGRGDVQARITFRSHQAQGYGPRG